MKSSSAVRIILKSLLIPIFSMLVLKKFNLFSYVTFVPLDYRFEAGLTLYLGVFEALVVYVETTIEKKSAHISCIFYKTEDDKNVKNTPTLICDEETGHVVYICCDIELEGNAKKLSQCVVTITLPDWITSQVNGENRIQSYRENIISLKFAELLPEMGDSRQTARCNLKIPFIQNSNEGVLRVKISPKLKKKATCLGVYLHTNEFEICNRR